MTPQNPADAILEITLRPGGAIDDVMRLRELRAPLFHQPDSRTGHGALIEVSGELPWRAGQTRRAAAWFLAPELARAQFPPGAAFWSFGMDGRIVEWLGAEAVVPAE
jgi:hypothetical protein